MDIHLVTGDLLNQPTESIVNPWNRNIIPWWLLLPQGVSGAIKARAGLQPFFELGKMGPIPLGAAVATSGGKLPYNRIIHVAGIDMLWRASQSSIEDSVINALALAEELQLKSLAFPIIGAGSGGFNVDSAQRIMVDVLEDSQSPIEVTLVRFAL